MVTGSKKRSTLGRTTEQGIVVPRTSEGSHPLGDGASRCDPPMSVVVGFLHAVGAVNVEKNLRTTVRVEAEQQDGALTTGAKLQAEKTGTLMEESAKVEEAQKGAETAVHRSSDGGETLVHSVPLPPGSSALPRKSRQEYRCSSLSVCLC